MSNQNYVCPQCGPDSNGSEVHALTHHGLPPMSVDEAKNFLQAQTKKMAFLNDFLSVLQKHGVTDCCLIYGIDELIMNSYLYTGEEKTVYSKISDTMNMLLLHEIT